VTKAESALDTLFPGGSYETVDFLYHRWAAARYFNGIVRAAAEAAVGARPGRMVRVLEVGAGTGGTAATLLPAMPPERVVYHFSDVSDFFLARARERFAAYPFVCYGLLDIEREPAEQGYPPHSFDIVVAANVLHATRNLDRTLHHVRELLAPGGVLIAYEATSHPRWADITTGLIEGWQLFEDTWRDDNPLLAPKRWDEALRANGFEEALALPEAGAATEVLGQHVLIARAPMLADDPAFIGSRLVDTEHPAPAAAASEPDSSMPDPLPLQLAEALPAERHELLVEYVRGHTMRVLRLDPARPPERDARLMDLGVDSLMAVELRNRLGAGLGLKQKLPATLIFDHPTIAAAARFLERLALPDPGPDAPTAAPARHEAPNTDVATIAGLSDDDVEALLLKKLDQLG
jgi:SAM-dependent methyltransferase